MSQNQSESVDHIYLEWPNTKTIYRKRLSIFAYGFSNLHKVQIWVGGRFEEYRSCKLHSDK